MIPILFIVIVISHISQAIYLREPDIIEISVDNITDVKEQLRQALGISWRHANISIVKVKLLNGTRQNVTLTRIFSKNSHPFIELIKAVPQIGPWAPFNDTIINNTTNTTIRPKTTLTWRVSIGCFEEANEQMLEAGLTLIAFGKGFAYYRGISGVQLQVILDELTPDPNDDRPNKPPPDIIDMGRLNTIQIAVPATMLTNVSADLILRKQISKATGIHWDVISQFPNITNISITSFGYSCEDFPFINIIATIPDVNPFFATLNSTTFNHIWIAPDSDLTPDGVDAMETAENQVIDADFIPIFAINAMDVGISVDVDIIRYFVGVDGVQIAILNAAFENKPTDECDNCCKSKITECSDY